MANDKAFNGTMLKYQFEFNADGFDMDRDDVSVTLKKGTKSLTITKEEMVKEPYTEIENNISVEKNYYYVCFDSSYFGPGSITVVVTAWIPDTDFEGGLRRYVHKFELVDVLGV